MYSKEVKIINYEGLHGQPVLLFSKTASQYKSAVYLSKGTKRVDAKNFLAVLSLAVFKDDVVVISAEGEDSQEAVDALEKLIISNFGRN